MVALPGTSGATDVRVAVLVLRLERCSCCCLFALKVLDLPPVNAPGEVGDRSAGKDATKKGHGFNLSNSNNDTSNNINSSNNRNNSSKGNNDIHSNINNRSSLDPQLAVGAFIITKSLVFILPL